MRCMSVIPPPKKRAKTQKQLEFEEEMRRPYFKDMTELARDPNKKYFEAQCYVGREQELFPGVACAEVWLRVRDI